MRIAAHTKLCLCTFFASLGLANFAAEPVSGLPETTGLPQVNLAPTPLAAPRSPGLLAYLPDRTLALAALGRLASETGVAQNAPQKGRHQIGVRREFSSPCRVDRRSVTKNSWTLLPDGWRLWSAKIESPGALGLRVQISAISIPDTVRFLAYAADNPPAYVLSMPGDRLRKTTAFWTQTVFASAVMVECQVGPGTDTDQIGFTLEAVSHLYDLPGVVGPTKAGDCHNDVSCYPNWKREAAGTARILFIDHGNTYLCTGCLLQANDPNQLADYFLTAYHCVGNQDAASTLECYWFYRTSSCGAPPPNLADVPRTLLGADFLAGSSTSDFAFLRLRQSTPEGVSGLSWTPSPPNLSDDVVTIHYPRGSYERISMGNLTGDNGDFWRVKWSSGVTEEGSSGAPLFNAAHQLVGQLYGGYSSCANPSGADLYGMFDKTYTAVRQWIDPGGGAGGPVSAPGLQVAAGTYAGLILKPDAATPEVSGSVVLKLTARNRFTVSLRVGSLRLSRTGTFDSSGRADLRFGQQAITVSLQARMDPDRIVGTISTSNWSTSLETVRVLTDRNAAMAYAGRYTAVATGSLGSHSLPNGNSIITFSAAVSGLVVFSGKLADGAPFNGSARFGVDGRLPFLARATGGETLMGWLQFSSEATSLGGDMVWMSKAGGQGFTLASSLSGCKYTMPTAGQSSLPMMQAQVTLAGVNLAQTVQIPIGFKSGGWQSDAGATPLQIACDRRTGLFRGQLRNSGSTIRIQGVFLQAQGIGSGFFLGPEHGGTVLIDSAGAQP